MAEEDDDEGFGDFKFASPQNLHINGFFTSSSSQNDDEWGDFFIAPQPFSRSLQPPQFNLSNGGFSLGFSSPNPPHSTTEPSPIRSDPNPNKFLNPRGALPLSLFGEEEEEEHDSIDNNSNVGLIDPNIPAQNGKVRVHLVSASNGFNNDDVLSKLYIQNHQIKPENGSGFNLLGLVSDLNPDEEDDEWEFKGALDGNSKELDASGSTNDSNMVVINQDKEAGQDASISVENQPGSSSPLSQFSDLFATMHSPLHKSGQMDVGLSSSSTTVMTNGFMSDLFPGVQEVGNGSGITTTSVNEDDDFDDFGDFVDASQKVESNTQEQLVPEKKPDESPLLNGKIQDEHSQPENSKGALPLFLFSDITEESSDCLNHEEEMVHKPISNPKNGFNSQGSGISIHDLISNLYSQPHPTSSAGSNNKLADNGVHFPQTNTYSTPLSGDDDWDDNSWEFVDASSETRVKEQFSSRNPGNLARELRETSSNLQIYTDFYTKLKEALYFLLSCQLDDVKRAQSSDAVIGNNGEAVALSNDAQKAFKLLEESMISQEVLSRKHLERSSCLNELLKVLQEPKLKEIESEYFLSKRLHLAENDWRIASELLRHSIEVLKIVSLGSVDMQSAYVSTWSKIINVCVQELKHGAFIWRRASEKNFQHQILSDFRGQKYIQALGEIYKVVELIGMSSKLYKPWVLISVSNPSQFLGLLEECVALWSSSGLEEALQNLSDNADFGCSQTVEALITSIKNILGLDMSNVYDCAFIQQKSICRLSLLPQEMLPGLMMVLWNEEPYFVNLANLWANLISCHPPQLPHMQVT